MKNTKLLFILILTLLFAGSSKSFSQADNTSTVKGVVLDKSTNNPLESATIQVFNSSDSSLINGALSDKEGKFSVNNIPDGNVYVRISYVGYTTAIAKNLKTGKSNKDINLGKVKLEPTTETTQEIEVTTEAPAMTFEAGKKIYDAKKDLTAQTGNTLDLLKNVPSVEVDNDGNVSLRGSSSVKILIDGKPSAMLSSGTQILQTIPANLVDKVEVITNPSSKYEAEGISGIINIVMKENNNLGYNGNIKMNGGTQDKYNISVGGSVKKGKLSLSGNYSYWNYTMPGTTQMNRLTLNSTNAYKINQDINWRYRGISQFGSIGIDYDINKFNTLSFVGNGFYYIRNMNANDLLSFYNSNNINTSNLLSRNFDSRDGFNFDGTLTYTKKYEEKGRDLTTFINFSTRKENADVNLYLSDGNNNNSLSNNKNDYRFNFANFQSDYVHPFDEKETYKLEAGLKSNARFIKGNYYFQVFDYSTNQWNSVPSKDNDANYKDLISAAYLNFSGKYKDFSYQAGLRSEHTYIDFSILKETQKYNNKYFDLFPSASISQKIGNENQFQLSYSRRINRPNLFFLNPFIDYIDEFTTRSGNPYLTPEYINNFELGYSRFMKIGTITLNSYFRNVNDVITFINKVDTNGVTKMAPENRGKSNTYGLELILQSGFAKWWTYNTSVSYYNTNVIDNTNGINFDKNYSAWNVRFMTNAAIPDLFDFSLSYFYNGKQVNAQGEISPFQMFSLALQKSFFDKRVIFGFRLNDVFNQQRFKMDRADINYSQNIYQKPGSRAAFLTLTYNFGEQINNKSTKTSQKKQREMEFEIQQTN